jgi:hypothetical protein
MHGNSQLVICENQGYHRFLHARTRVKRLGGNPNTDAWCGHCHQMKPHSAFSGDSSNTFTGLYRWCRECNNEGQRQRRRLRNQALTSATTQMISGR